MPVPQRLRSAAAFGAIAAVIAGLLVAKWQALHDPPFWDALGGYVAQARYFAIHGFDWAAYRGMEFVRPPIYTGSLAVVIRLGGDSAFVMHLWTFLFGAIALAATYAIARRLGATRLTSVAAVVLAAVTPMFFTQVGALQSDLMCTAFAAVAWALLLHDRRWGFAIFASLAVVTKESGYFIWMPAMYLLYRRDMPRRIGGIVRTLLPVGVPVMVVLGWELLHNQVVGHVLCDNYLSNFKWESIPRALYHNYVEGGRWLMWLAAAPAILLRSPDRAPIVATAVCAAILPLVFPFGLPRYMLLAIPFLAAVVAIGLERLPIMLGAPAAVALAAFLVFGWNMPLQDSPGGYHRDANMRYRELLALEITAAREIAALHPRQVVAPFPMGNVLAAPPGDGFLPAPVPVTYPHPGDPMDQLCSYDLLVHDAQGEPNPSFEPLQKAGALTLWKTFGSGIDLIEVYRVSCP